MSGREVSRPYQVWFFAEGDLFFMFLFQSPSISPLSQSFLKKRKLSPNLSFYLRNFCYICRKIKESHEKGTI